MLLLGAHRSGTSALARVLNICGCDLPATLMGASYGNETGHWESSSISAFNDEVLNVAGSRWDDCLRINAAWYRSAHYGRYRERGTELLKQEFRNSPLFVLKDPRICRLAPFWLDILAAANVQPSIILPIRDPSGVAGSLARRDETPEWFGGLLWLRHVLDAEAGTRGRTRVFTSFYGLFLDWRREVDAISDRLNVAFPRVSSIAVEEIDSFLMARGDLPPAPAQRAQSRPHRGWDVEGWLGETYAILERWVCEGETELDYAQLDRIKWEFDHASCALGRALLPDHVSGVFGQGVIRQQERDQSIDDDSSSTGSQDGQNQKLLHYEDAIVSLRQQLQEGKRLDDELRKQLAQRDEELEVALRDLDAVRNQLGFAENRLRQREEEVHQYSATIDELKGVSAQTAILRERIKREEAWVFDLSAQRKAFETQVAQQTTLIGRLEARIASLIVQLENGRRELAESSARAECERAANHLLVEDARKATTRAEEYSQQLAGQRDRQTTLRNEAQEKAKASVKEVVLLTKLLQDRESRLETSQRVLEGAQNEIREQSENAERLIKLLQERENRLAESEHIRHSLQIDQRTRFEELAKVSSLLLQRESDRSNAQWLHDISLLLLRRTPLWWRLMPRKWQIEHNSRRLWRAGLFDAKAYLSRYPDVAAEGIDPFKHYMIHGLSEGRDRVFD